MAMSEWLRGLLFAERYYKEYGELYTTQGNNEYAQGTQAYKEHISTRKLPRTDQVRLAVRLARIERAYCHLVSKLNYAVHTELEVLGILQRLKDKRRKLICKVYAYELTR